MRDEAHDPPHRRTRQLLHLQDDTVPARSAIVPRLHITEIGAMDTAALRESPATMAHNGSTMPFDGFGGRGGSIGRTESCKNSDCRQRRPVVMVQHRTLAPLPTH